ncbi:MAG: hypothetical protein FP820_10815 [Sulfurimonas sp.]|jgi:hydrogenase maturation protease|nr:hypothetical protein [Sulfurimonas sp.]MBU1215921.1 hypothetical protein [bacterium]MBU1435600.1 hypothetical protein [bacterium]MBU1502476.1 hypothetical protein [bacterium]MBU3938119.1 hypothetical protein [bacterium]
MRVIIGYGNTLRGEDAFGVDVLKELEKFEPKETTLVTAFALIPELILELLEADEVVFVDACYSKTDHYALACNMLIQQTPQFSHHISPEILISMLKTLYNRQPKYFIYSMFSNSYEKIKNKSKYQKCIYTLALHLAAHKE